ncbi:MAG TPA: alpha/beta fold hydrolase [Flavobacteriales bacterium]|nr:alpha/beta fold hydrolase [Flavobacteriales bacterium]
MEHTWVDKNEYPFKANYYITNEHKLHYIDEGMGEPILFVHGTPSWSFDWRHCIKELSKTHRCIAIDHIGFGLSDKPMEYNYSTRNHSKTLEKFIFDKGLENITLVVHDFGGPIGLSVAINHPQCINRIVILNSWLWSSENDPEFQKFKRILKSPLLPFLYRKLNFSARYILPKSFGQKKLSKQLRKQYTQPFASSKKREGTLAFARSLLTDQGWFENLWNKRGTIEHKPVLFIWGMADPVLKPHLLDKFVSGFTRSTVCKLEGCGHFPQEEEHAAVVNCMNRFIAGDK